MLSELLLTIFMLLFSVGMFFETTRFRATSIALIGPTYWPRIILGTIIILSSILIVKLIKNRKDYKVKESEGIAYPLNIWITLALTVLYTVIMPIIGFPISTLLVLTGLFIMLNVRKMKKLIPLTAGVWVGLIILFPKLLGVPLPRGNGIFRMISLWFY